MKKALFLLMFFIITIALAMPVAAENEPARIDIEYNDGNAALGIYRLDAYVTTPGGFNALSVKLSYDNRNIIPIDVSSLPDRVAIAVPHNTISTAPFNVSATYRDTNSTKSYPTAPVQWKTNGSRTAFKFDIYLPATMVPSVTGANVKTSAFEFYFTLADSKTLADLDSRSFIIESDISEGSFIDAWSGNTPQSGYGCYISGYAAVGTGDEYYYSLGDDSTDTIAVSLTYPNSDVPPPTVTDATLSIGSSVSYGSQVTANFTTLLPTTVSASDFTYRWQLGTDNDGTINYADIADETSLSYTPTASDIGKYLRVVATAGPDIAFVAGSTTSNTLVVQKATQSIPSGITLSGSRVSSGITLSLSQNDSELTDLSAYEFAVSAENATTAVPGTYQSSNSITGLTSTSGYFLFARLKETSTNLPSEPISIRALAAPTNITIGGTYGTSVSWNAVTGANIYDVSVSWASGGPATYDLTSTTYDLTDVALGSGSSSYMVQIAARNTSDGSIDSAVAYSSSVQLYVVTLDYNDDTTTQSKFAVQSGYSVALTTDMTSSGRVFRGWSYSSTVGSAVISGAVSFTSETTLYAQWNILINELVIPKPSALTPGGSSSNLTVTSENMESALVSGTLPKEITSIEYTYSSRGPVLNPTFKGGDEINANVILQCLDGYELATNAIVTAVDGTVQSGSTQNTYVVSYPMLYEAISIINLTPAPPQIGGIAGSVAKTDSSATGYNVSSSNWSGQTEGDGARYASGDTAVVIVTLNAATGYYFTENYTVNLAGGETVATLTGSQYQNNTTLNLTITFTSLSHNLMNPRIVGSTQFGETLSVFPTYPSGAATYEWKIGSSVVGSEATFTIPYESEYYNQTVSVTVTGISQYITPSEPTATSISQISASTFSPPSIPIVSVSGKTLTVTNPSKFDTITPPITAQYGIKEKNASGDVEYFDTTTFNVECGKTYVIYGQFSALIKNSVTLINASNATYSEVYVPYLDITEVTVQQNENLSSDWIESLTAQHDSALDGNVNYQWYRNGTPISGATNKTYNLQLEDIGAIHYVTVTGKTGSDYQGDDYTSTVTSTEIPKLSLLINSVDLSSVFYGQRLSAVTVDNYDIIDKHFNNSVSATLTWNDNSIIPENNTGYNATFVPEQTNYYYSLNSNLQVSVTAANPVLELTIDPPHAQLGEDTTIEITTSAKNAYDTYLTDVPTVSVVSVIKHLPGGSTEQVQLNGTSFVVPASDTEGTYYVINAVSEEVSGKYNNFTTSKTLYVQNDNPNLLLQQQIKLVKPTIDTLMNALSVNWKATGSAQSVIEYIQNAVLREINTSAPALNVSAQSISFSNPIVGIDGLEASVNGSATVRISLYGLNSENTQYSDDIGIYTVPIISYSLPLFYVPTYLNQSAEHDETLETSSMMTSYLKLYSINTSENTVAYYINNDGSESIVKLSYYNNGKLIWLGSNDSDYYLKEVNPIFTDVEGHWASEYIYAVSRTGLFIGTGDNLFSPNSKMTGGMLLTAIARLAGVDLTAADSEQYYEPYVAWAVDNGLLNDLELFDPEMEISRLDASVIIGSFIESQDISLTASSEGFTDSDAIPEYAKERLAQISGAGIILGRSDGSFDPFSGLTRAEISTIFTRIIPLLLSRYE